MKPRAIVWICLSYIAGILAGLYFSLPLPLLLVIILCLLLGWFLAFQRNKPMSVWFLIAAFAVLGAFRYGWQEELLASRIQGMDWDLEREMRALVRKGPVKSGNNLLYELLLESGARIQLLLEEGEGSFAYGYGDKLLVRGKISPPPTARNPGEFDYRAYLRQQGILGQAVFPRQLVLLEKGSDRHPLAAVFRVREKAEGAFVEAMSPRTAAVARALVFGDKSALEKEVKETFLSLGIIHLMAVSGLHVGFLVAAIEACRRLFHLRLRSGFFLTLFLLVFYSALTGFSPSVLRASLMATMVLLGHLVGRERDFYTALAAAALILLLFNPHYLFQSGFQLSFLTTWGLVYYYPLLEKCLSGLPSWRPALIVPLAAQIAALPLTALYFNLVSIIGVLVNVLVVPLAGLVVIGGLFSLIFLWALPFLSIWLLASLGAVLDFMLTVLSPVSKWPGSSLMVATPSLGLILFYYLVTVFLREWQLNQAWREKYPHLGRRGMALILLLVFLFLGWQQFSPKPLEVVFLDVGQGDAILIRTPRGRTCLLDGGGSHLGEGNFRVGRDRIIPYLQRRGIYRVDFLISSHPDLDHLQGLEDVLLHLPVRAVILPPPGLFAEGYETFLPLAEKKGCRLVEVKAGDLLRLEDGLVMEILNPPDENPVFTSSPDNNHSLAIRLIYGTTEFLFAGDLEEEALEYLVDKDLVRQVTVFKFPHHGSRTGFYVPFLDLLQPEAVVVSVGRNSFGHPAPEVISYWEETNTPLYRTDRDGAVTVFSDGERIRVEKFLREE
ncbi:MAG: DNA internalization-related competence protein ComEC/Rec2 [Bacillota bacterium]|jgi:competence protein ComEC